MKTKVFVLVAIALIVVLAVYLTHYSPPEHVFEKAELNAVLKTYIADEKAENISYEGFVRFLSDNELDSYTPIIANGSEQTKFIIDIDEQELYIIEIHE